jgi:type VI secretion system protein ImpC
MADATVMDAKKFLSSMRLGDAPAAPKAMITDNYTKVTEDVSDEERFLAGLAAVVFNVDPQGGKFDRAEIQKLLKRIDSTVETQLHEIIHNTTFQQFEGTWRGIDYIIQNTNFRANIMIDLLDVGKAELQEDFENNSTDLTGGALFKKVYVAEYDQYGGKPYGAMLGFFPGFEFNPKELGWLRQMGKVAAVAHTPFLGAVAPKFFGCNSAAELAAIKDLTSVLAQPKYGPWASFRDTPEAAYVGLALPRYLARLPWHPETNPPGDINYTEETGEGDDAKFCWGSAVALFARNMIKSFETSGWCQHVRGPKGGGLVTGLPTYTFTARGEKQLKLPVEITIPDSREYEFANSGFIPLIYRKGTADACFFSAQSTKIAKKFKDPKDSENSQLVTNLSYTFSITRIAHYMKCMMRDNIGSTADESYVKNQISGWISQYCTKVTNPDDATLRYFPFKAAKVEVKKCDGLVGQYSATISILPHVQFEGMDCELRLESRLG